MFQVFSKDYINLLLSSYFFILGVLALSHVFGSVWKLSLVSFIFSINELAYLISQLS